MICDYCKKETDILYYPEIGPLRACRKCYDKMKIKPNTINNKEVQQKMNELETPIGTKEQAKLSAGSVTVKSVTIEPPKEGSKAKLVVLHCKHPDREELIRMSNMKVKKVQGDNETIKKDTLWWNVDEDEKIKKNSAVAHLMTFYKKEKLKEFKDVSINTEEDASGYLCIKAY